MINNLGVNKSKIEVHFVENDKKKTWFKCSYCVANLENSQTSPKEDVRFNSTPPSFQQSLWKFQGFLAFETPYGNFQ